MAETARTDMGFRTERPRPIRRLLAGAFGWVERFITTRTSKENLRVLLERGDKQAVLNLASENEGKHAGVIDMNLMALINDGKISEGAKELANKIRFELTAITAQHNVHPNVRRKLGQL